MITITTKRGNVIDVDESKSPRDYLTELNYAKSLFMSGDITYDILVQAAERYIESIKLYGKRKNKRVPVPSLSKLLR